MFVFSLLQTGYIGALPHLLMTIVVPLGGLLADHIRKNGILSTTSVRKIFNCGGFGMEATFFLVLANARTPLMATIALTCGVAFSGFAISGKCSESVPSQSRTILPELLQLVEKPRVDQSIYNIVLISVTC